MVKIIDYRTRSNDQGKEFNVLIVQGGVEPIKSRTTGKVYLNKTGPKRSEGRICNGRMRTEADKKHIKSIVDEFHNCLTPIPITDCWYEYNNKYQSDPGYDPFTG